MLNEIELKNEIVLSEDIYKHNTLILKKGCVLNPYLINKLEKFGISKYKNKSLNAQKSYNASVEILILDNDVNSSNKTRNILEFAGFESNKILQVNDTDSLICNITSRQ